MKIWKCQACGHKHEIKTEEAKAESVFINLLDAAIELLIVAKMRGDNKLPANPANDIRLWTVRMQNAWDDLDYIIVFF